MTQVDRPMNLRSLGNQLFLIGLVQLKMDGPIGEGFLLKIQAAMWGSALILRKSGCP